MDFYDCDKNFFGPRVLLNCPGVKTLAVAENHIV